MVRKSSQFDLENGAWVMCSRKDKLTDESKGLQFCVRHMKRRPSNISTHTQSMEIIAERTEVNKYIQDLLRASQDRPILRFLDKQQRRVQKQVKREWGKALDWLSRAVAYSLECWVATHSFYQENDSEPGSTLHQLHWQTLTLVRMITDHCKQGQVPSAIVLWRSLFEIEVNMAFIAKGTTQKPSRAERYNDWSQATYLLNSNLRSGERMTQLRRKYKNWNLANHDGWTASPDNPKATLDLTNRASQVGYSRRNGRQNQYTSLDIYNLCHSYVHGNMFAILNDPLTSRGSLPDVPSLFDLDTPVCLIASSLSKIAHVILENHPDTDKNVELSEFGKFADICETQVQWDVAVVREELLSPLGGIDMSMRFQSDDGTEYTVRPARRGQTESKSKDFDAYFGAERESLER